MGIEIYYKGDESWNRRVDFYRCYWGNNSLQIKLLEELNNQFDLTIVINGILEEEALSWINRKIPALENMRPKDCLKEDLLLKRLKVCLTRMPSGR